jgi:malate synthase
MTVTVQKPPSVTAVPRDLGGGVTLHPEAGSARARALLTPEVVRILAALHRQLEPERQRLLQEREVRQGAYDRGVVPTYLAQDSEAVQGEWRVAPVPPDLQRRRVEITGPANDTKMIIKMLSRNEAGHRADCAMVDFEDSMKPTWENVVDGVHNVAAAARQALTFVKPGEGGGPEQLYTLDPGDMAKLLVRVRGLHLREAHLQVDGAPIAAGLFDLVLCLAHGAAPQVERGETPAFYVPKVEHHREAAWWNRLFALAQEALGLPVGTLRATFLIETLPAAFQMEEILHAVRDHGAGLNVGRWDKIFSDIKVLREHPERILADRATIGMNRPWMEAYARRLIRICHRRGAWAIGGMAAFTPGKGEALRRQQTEKVRADKRFEFELGHDGCWVSHPYFIGPALEAFPRDDQRDVLREDDDPCPDLLPQGGGPYTLEGLRTNVRVAIAYLEGWQRGLGCIAWDDLMEDLATLEISRAQVWQWRRHGVQLGDGLQVDEALVRRIFDEELERICREVQDTLGIHGSLGTLAAARQKAFAAAQREAVALFCESNFRPFLNP